jgi:alpha-beta hydrolase superfamily lysophospholipase
MERLLETSRPGFPSLASAPRALLVIAHGLAEYADRYRAIADVFAARGISTFVFDQRGHGDDPGPRTHVDRFDDYVADLLEVIGAVRRQYPALPLFLWGHSMGSIVVTLATSHLDAAPAGVITSSNSLGIFRRGLNPLNPFFRIASGGLPKLRIPLGLDGTRISTDEAVQRAYSSDPRIPPTASLRLIVEFAGACERCRTGAPRLQVPWLNVHGEDDRIAPVEGSRVLHDALGSADKTVKTWPGLRHELHNEREPERTSFLAFLGDWILARAH